MSDSSFSIPCITNDAEHCSVFSSIVFPKHPRGGMLLTDRIDAQNLRLRESAPGYQTDWHMAGDPTLIAVQQGTLRIILQNGTYKDFIKGESFIAQDYLPETTLFDPTKHGHKAKVIGNEILLATHIKLGNRY